MRNDQIMSYMTEMDDELLLEAAPGACDMAALKKSRRLRSVKTLVIVLCAIAVFGGAAYASGVFTAPFSIYRSAETEVKNRQMFVNGVEVDFIDIDVQVPVVSQKKIKGAVRSDLEAAMQETMKIEYNTSDWVPLSKEGQYGYVDDVSYQVLYSKSFKGQKEALDYIGLKNYELQYFPYDKYKFDLICFASVFKGGEMEINHCDYSIKSVNEKMRIELSASCPIVSGTPKEGDICNMGAGGFPGDGSMTVETFTNAHGYNGAKAYTNSSMSEWARSALTEGQDKYTIQGFVVKNSVQYSINIRSDWADKAEAEQIFDTWAENF